MKTETDKGFDALEALCNQPTTAGFGDRLKVIRDVMAGLIGSGAVRAKDVWTWLPVILQLLVELGPAVQAIVDRIREAIGGGKTAETFS